MDWLRALLDAQRAGRPSVLVTVAATRGSVPREAGAHLLVTADGEADSLGGGHLEYRAIAIARSMLETGDRGGALQRFSLGASLGQCCGGAVQLLFERIESNAGWPARLEQQLQQGLSCLRRVAVDASGCVLLPPQAGESTGLVRTSEGLFLLDVLCPCHHEVRVFGAGHVGAALVKLLAALDCRVLWVDEREDRLRQPPPGVAVHDDPLAAVSDARPGCCYVVMTHDHRLDLRLAEAILRRNDSYWFGLIGSRSKRARFEHRLRDKGLDPDSLKRMTCPIGIAGIHSKKPQAIALAVAAQLQQLFEAAGTATEATLNAREAV